MTLIFPDLETILVAYFKQVFAESPNASLAGIHVGTQHIPAGQSQPNKQVVITVAYNGEQTAVTKFASLTIEIYANDSVEATELALQVEALARRCTDARIKRSTIRLGPVRTTEKGQQERRSLDIELVVLGSEFN